MRFPFSALLPWLVAALLTAAGCDGSAPAGGTDSRATSPAHPATNSRANLSAPAAPIPDGPPQITFDALIHDFGVISETQPQTAAFHFTNSGGQTLIIEQIKVACGCTAPTLAKRHYQPGERGQIDVVFTPAGPGNDPKLINVFTNVPPTNPDEPFVRLQIHANVQPFIVLQPRKLDLGILEYRQRHEFQVNVDCPPDERFTIEAAATTNPHVTARALPPTAGRREQTVIVTVEPSAAWGNLFAWLEITVRGQPAPDAAPILHTSKTRVQGQMFGQLRAAPWDTFRFGAKPGESFERRIQLTRPSGEPFEITAATLLACDLPGATIAFTRRSESAYDLIFKAVADRVRPVEGTVRVTTSVPGEEQIEIPIAGVIRIDDPSVR